MRKQIEKYVLENSSFLIGGPLKNDEMEHVVDIAVSIVSTRDCSGPRGGSFVRAVVDNNLEGAISTADSTCLRALKLLVLVNLWCHPR